MDRAERTYHAVVRSLERLTDAERQEVWNRLREYGQYRTSVQTGKTLNQGTALAKKTALARRVTEAHKRAHGLTPESALWDDPRWYTEWGIDTLAFIEALHG